MDLRICRPDDSHELDHYWNCETGLTVADDFNAVTFTPECLCPLHGTLPRGTQLRNKKGRVIIIGDSFFSSSEKTNWETTRCYRCFVKKHVYHYVFANEIGEGNTWAVAQ